MTDSPAYIERVSSARTEALFVALTLLFFLLFAWRAEIMPGGRGGKRPVSPAISTTPTVPASAAGA